MKPTAVLTLLICFTTSFANAEDLKLFNLELKTSTPALKAEMAKLKEPNTNLDSLIEELRRIAYAEKAKKEDKLDLASFLLHKVILQHQKPYEENLVLLTEAFDALPGDYTVEGTWGDLLFVKADYENAIPHLENALNANPNDVNIVGKLGIANANILHFEKATDYLKIYLDKYPQSFYPLLALGKCQLELHDYDDAIDSFERALELTDKELYKKSIQDLIRKAKEAMATAGEASQEEDQRFVITFAGNSREDLSDITFDMLDEIYYDVTNLIGINPEVRINIIFFLTEDYYKSGQDWAAASAEDIQIKIPLKTGYKSQEYVKGLLAHEFTHTLVNLKSKNRAPLWVHEGLAQYQEYSTSYGSPDVLRSDFQSCLNNDFLEGDLFIPLDSVPSYIGSNDRQNVVRGYVASYMAIRCMADLYGEQSFDTLLTSIGQGKTIGESVEEATGLSYSEFQEEYKNWIKGN